MLQVPHDIGAERSVLGAILLEPKQVFHVLDLPPEAFFHEPHRVLFLAMARNLGKHKTTDPSLLASQLRDQGDFDRIGGAATILQLLDGVSRSTNVPHYANILRDYQTRREAIQAAQGIAAAARSGAREASEALQAYADRFRKKRVEPTTAFDLSAILTAPLPKVPWIAEGWIGHGDFVVLAGEWATGKSVLALDLALSVASGDPWMRKIPVLKTGAVVYCDEENNPVNATRRLRRLLLGREIQEERARSLPLRYLNRNRIKLDSNRGKHVLRSQIEESGAVLVVLDSYIRFARMNANHNDELARFYDECAMPLIAEYNVSILALDHMRKPQKDDDRSDEAHRISGGSEKSNQADGTWTLTGARDTDSRTLACRKNRWEDMLPPPMTTRWIVSEDEEAAWIEASDALIDAEITIRRLVAEAGDRGTLATPLYEAAQRAGVNRRTAIRITKRLCASGVVESRKEAGRCVRYWPRGVSLIVPA